MQYYSDAVFNKQTDVKQDWFLTEFDHCVFNQIDFSNQDLSGSKFMDCQFDGCNLALANIQHTAFQNVIFNQTKLSGLQFDTCNPFALSFRFNDCILQHATFFKLTIPKTIFVKSDLTGADFTETNLTESIFDACNLSQAIFEKTKLTRVDFTSAFHFSIDPNKNDIKKAQFSIDGLPGLLEAYNIIIR